MALSGYGKSSQEYPVNAGFNLTACDIYFIFLVEVFMNHNLAENIFRKSYRVNRTPDYGLKTCKQVPNYLKML